MHVIHSPIISSDKTLDHIAKEAMQLAQKSGLFTPSQANTQPIVQLSGIGPSNPLYDGPSGGW